MMTRFMMWCYTWVLGLVVMMAGTGAIENPNGHVDCWCCRCIHWVWNDDSSNYSTGQKETITVT